MQKFDAVVVGGGPGGYACAIRLSQNGLRTALVEEGELGGTCLNRGCIPTKALLHAADIYHTATHGGPFGIDARGVTFDYARILARKDAVVRQLGGGIAFLEQNYGVTVFRSRAVLEARDLVALDSGERLSCGSLVVATGSRPAPLPIPGAELPGVVDSTGLLERTVCPRRIVIVGGGVAGVEFATFFCRLGVGVTLVERLDRVLPSMDREVSRFVADELTRYGVELVLGAGVESIAPGLEVRYTAKDGAAGSAGGDVVLLAAGRVPNTGGIGLEAIGVELDAGGYVKTDGACRTSVPGVYAVGDITGKMHLAHVATAQGTMAADHIAGKPCRQLDLARVPSCVYCSPEASMVGLTEEQARAAGRVTGTGVFSLSGNGMSLLMGQPRGFVKLVFDRDTEELLGFHMVGPRAAELAAGAAAVMTCGGTIGDLGGTVHPHPTVSEAVMEAAHVCRGNSVHVSKDLQAHGAGERDG